MSIVLRTVESFPRGRTTEQLSVILGASFDHVKKVQLIAELDDLARTRKIVRGTDGKWRPGRNYASILGQKRDASTTSQPDSETDTLLAAPARFDHIENKDAVAQEDDDQGLLNAGAVLRYWRSALRADPRGATTAREDLHGVDWHLVCGAGQVCPSDQESVVVSITLDHLQSEFRKALLRREGEENALAVGWPLAVGQRSGVPAVFPVGLLSAIWSREDDTLRITITHDDVLINPDWLSFTARSSGWSKTQLSDVFATNSGIGLPSAEFVSRLREAAAGQFRGKLSGADLSTGLSFSDKGILDIIGIFLPSDSSFTAGASRDLDKISAWSADKLQGTALSSLLGLPSPSEVLDNPALNLAELNFEQLTAVQNACSAPISVITGPPGTGKSQTIVSIAGTVLAQGGSVLVASKNHQALDAVEDRLGNIAANLPFQVRTLDPRREVDQSFTDILAELSSHASGEPGCGADEEQLQLLEDLCSQRRTTLDVLRRRAEIECELAETLDRLAAFEKAGGSREEVPLPRDNAQVDGVRASVVSRILHWIATVFRRKQTAPTISDATPKRNKRSLERHRDALRKEKAKLPDLEDPIDLGKRIQILACAEIPALLKERVHLNDETRRSLAQAKQELDFEGSKAAISRELAQSVLKHRPLWLASVLGAPKRLPLDDGLFDLVIFDEASQCDIASAVPLMARARKAVVVGDDRQLSFIPQLGLSQDRNLIIAQKLPLKEMSRLSQSQRSLFDCALATANVPNVTLRHQYRSAGSIVDYISTNFYGGTLVVAQPPETIRLPKGLKPGLDWTDIKAPAVPDQGNVNKAERDAIVEELAALLVEGQYEGSIGVIAPFRSQVQAIEEAVRGRGIPELRLTQADFRVGTVDSFQGQERDVIFFSPCLGPSSPMTAVTFVQRDPRRLNVAISRARTVARIFGDLSFARSGKVRSLARLAAHATEPRVRTGEGVFDSDWERKVYHALKDRGLDPRPQHEIAGRRLDFALFGKSGIKLDLEVDGRRWHQTADGQRKSADIWRDQQLKALGWRVRRFWVDELSEDMESCLDRVEQDLA